jgi:glycosyltransferase involved in cell wall biosynthesis
MSAGVDRQRARRLKFASMGHTERRPRRVAPPTREGPPKVMFVCPNLKAGGAERQWALLVPSLSERGFDVSVLTLDGCGVYFDEVRARGVPVACAGLRHRADPLGLARAVKLGGSRAAAVLTRGVSAHLVGHVLAQRQRAAHVATEHLGDDPLGMRPLRPHQRLLLGPVRPRANAVVAVATSQTERLVRDGYRRDAIRVIASGVADDPPVRDRDAVRVELDVSRDAFLAVLVAALRPEKRAAVFVEQVTAAHAVEPSIRGLVIGDGPDAGSVAGAVAGSNGAVRMVGFRPDAVDIMHAADVVCLTSAVEALPISVLEAMSVARAVLAISVGGLPEVIENGETGILIPPDRPADMALALVELARSPARAEALGRAGRARQQRSFSIEAMTRGYADLLADLNWAAARARRRDRIPI